MRKQRTQIAPPRALTSWIVLLAMSCGDPSDGNPFDTANGTAAATGDGEGGPGDDGTAADDDGAEGADDEEGGGPKLDVGGGDDGPGGAGECHVPDDGLDAAGECRQSAPPDSFTPTTQWTWDGPDGETDSGVIPLVANLTDDNGDGSIDLCDVPDVVVTVTASFFTPGSGHVYVLDGATGAVHFVLDGTVDPTVTPALGDIDGDGLPEIVAARYEMAGLALQDRLVAFEHDGSEAWVGADVIPYTEAVYGAIALADMDADGDVEIAFGTRVFDQVGNEVWAASDAFTFGAGHAVAVADLDGDGTQELVLGHSAYRADGSSYDANPQIGAGYPQVANLDDDEMPEVLVLDADGIAILEHDGTTKLAAQRPTGDPAGGLTWTKPATVHDFDGDGAAELATGSANNYTVYERDAQIVWMATVSDQSGSAAGTAFDFLGDGTAEAMYADEHTLFIFDGDGVPYLQVPRSSGTIIEYPVVVDVDNDSSAEILVVSNFDPETGGATAPTLQVIRDERDRWIPARRIWNQHTYHVTNVREDGTIPTHEPPSWAQLNTYRTNSQIEGGVVCIPPEG
jgi:hypothetical protein